MNPEISLYLVSGIRGRSECSIPIILETNTIMTHSFFTDLITSLLSFHPICFCSNFHAQCLLHKARGIGLQCVLLTSTTCCTSSIGPEYPFHADSIQDLICISVVARGKLFLWNGHILLLFGRCLIVKGSNWAMHCNLILLAFVRFAMVYVYRVFGYCHVAWRHVVCKSSPTSRVLRPVHVQCMVQCSSQMPL